MEKALTVSQLNNYIKGVFEDELILQSINVVGEILEYKVSNNNTYILIKDELCMLSCVGFSIFSGFRVGQNVMLTGSVRFYNKNGKVSFVFSDIKLKGEGKQLAFLKDLKERLQKEGVFSNNRALPALVRSIALITSRQGAAIVDFLSILKPLDYLNVYILPCKMQGEGAGEEIIQSLSKVNNELNVDAVIITRGGGSAGDLSEFNSEALAKMIFKTKVPVISAVGHEIDYTLCDFAADLRVSTPTKAAETILSNNSTFFNRLIAALNLSLVSIKKNISIYSNKLMLLAQKISFKIQVKNQRLLKLILFKPTSIYQALNLALDKHRNKINIFNHKNFLAVKENLASNKNRIDVLFAQLQQQNPIKILSKGYAKVYKNLSQINNANQLSAGDEFNIVFFDGSVSAKVLDKKD